MTDESENLKIDEQVTDLASELTNMWGIPRGEALNIASVYVSEGYYSNWWPGQAIDVITARQIAREHSIELPTIQG